MFPPLNLDGNYEIFKIRFDGTSRTILTNSALDAGSLLPVASGNGTRVVFYAVGTTIALRSIDGTGGSGRDLVSFDLKFIDAPAITPDGSRAVFTRRDGALRRGAGVARRDRRERPRSGDVSPLRGRLVSLHRGGPRDGRPNPRFRSVMPTTSSGCYG